MRNNTPHAAQELPRGTAPVQCKQKTDVPVVGSMRELDGDTPVAFTRQELVQLRERCLSLASVKCLNPTWQRAYIALADAADRLDGMIARTIVVSPQVFHRGCRVKNEGG